MDQNLKLTKLLVLGWPMVLVLPKEKPVLWVVWVAPKGLKRLLAGCWAGCPNRPPVVGPKVPEAAAEQNRVDTAQFQFLSGDVTSCDPLTCSKRALIGPEAEAGVRGGGAEQTRGGAGRGCGAAKQAARPRCHWVGWTLPARLVVLQPELLGRETTTRSMKVHKALGSEHPVVLFRSGSDRAQSELQHGSKLTSRDLFSYSFMAVMHWCLVLMLVVTPAFTIVSLPVGG